MTDLRGAIIRLARKNPSLRSDLLPFLKQATEFDTPEALEKYLKEHPGADKSKHTVKKEKGEAGGGADSKDGPKGKWVSEYKPEKFYSPEHEEAWESVKFHAQKRDDLEDKLKKKIKGPVPEDVYFHADPKSKTVWFKDEKGGVVNVPNTQRESAELNDVFGALREEVKKMDREEEKGKRKEEEAGSKKATLRASLIRLAHENPELRSHLLPILTAKSGAVTPTPEMRLASLTVKLAHKPILQPQGLDMRAVKEGMGTMLYFIDGAKNHSKFYEMLVVPSGGGFTLMRRWGALTDTGMTGRVDSKDMPFMSLRQAQAELAKIYREKVGKGYKDAFNGKMHVSPATGERLPLGQYPVGLTRTPGFGWGTQSATVCIPSLRDLQEKLDSALNELEEDSDLSMLLADMEGAQRLINALMRNPQAIEAETNKSMGDIIDKAMKTPLSRIRALQGMARTGPGRLPDLDRGKLRSELVAIRNYVRKQLSYCA